MMRRAIACGLLLATLPACGQTTRTTTPEGEASRRAVLASTVTQVILPAYERFAERTTALEAALATYASAEAGADEAADTSAVRAAWESAMTAWQETELFILGPAAPSTEPGGKGLRDRIYAWPITNACRVDQETVRGSWEDPATLASAAANVRGLAAIERLLFAPPSNACPPQASINADGSWAAMDEESLRRRRADHARALGVQLSADASELLAAWRPDAGNFAQALSEAGLTGPYRSAQEGLNTLSDAMFYLDKEVKDTKLAVPLALRDCVTEVCPEKTENPLSRRSGAHLVANLRAFQRLVLGGPDAATGVGFDDLLIGLGADSLAATLTQRIELAIAALEAIDGPLEEALVNSKAQVIAAYDAVRAVTDILKTELLSVLDLELPQRAEGDND